MMIPDAATADWRDVCLAFAEHYKDITEIYLARLRDKTHPDNLHKPWANRVDDLVAGIKEAAVAEYIWRERADETL